MNLPADAELAAFLDAAEAAVAVVRAVAGPPPSAEILLVNGALVELTGHAREQLVGRSLRRLKGESEPRQRFARLVAAIRAGEPVEGPLVLAAADGRELSVRARLVPPPGLPGRALLWLHPEASGDARPGTAEDLLRGIRPWAELVGEGLYLLTLAEDGGLTLAWANARCRALLGRGEADPALVPGPVALAVSGDRGRTRLFIQRLLAGEEAVVRYRLRTADGTLRPVEDRARPVRDEQGLVRLVVGALRERAECGLEPGAGAPVDRLAGLLADRTRTAVALVDEAGRVRRQVGRLPDGREPAELLAGLGPREQDRWAELVDQALDSAEPVHAVLPVAEGTAPPMLAVELHRLDEALVLALLGAAAEAVPVGPTPAVAHEAVSGLAEAPAGFAGPGAGLLDAVAAAILGLDPHGLVCLANEAAGRLLGREPDRLLGRPIETLLGGVASPGELRALLLDQLPRSRAVRELQGLREQGEPVPVEVAAQRTGSPDAPFVLLTLRDATVARHTEETLRTLAYLDPLTGLPNRILFNDRLDQAIARARRARQLLAVLLLDLDRFKLVNDSLGLERGDQLLRMVGERLVATLRRSDTVARLAGDRFLILLTGLEQTEAVVKVAHKLLAALQPPFTINGHELSFTASIGVAVYPHDGEEPGVLVKNADTALGRAKELGRGHVQFYTNDMNAQAFERLMLENRLRRALENAELVVYYQPQLSLRSGLVVGVEALVRWFHPELGLVPPGEFIPLAEESGLILPIGFWAMETACAQVRAWQVELDRPELRLAVNLSARQFQHAELAARIAEILERTGFPARCLELELTESVVMREAKDSMRRMRELTALGLALAIDDFGTGYSSLAYLRSFPIRSLKIDRSFVQDVDRDPSSATIVQAIVAMGASLGLNVVAEGVETSQQLRLLRHMGCHEIQGFLASRALPAADLFPVVRDGHLEDDRFVLGEGG